MGRGREQIQQVIKLTKKQDRNSCTAPGCGALADCYDLGINKRLCRCPTGTTGIGLNQEVLNDSEMFAGCTGTVLNF
jgi:hypothetical protein